MGGLYSSPNNSRKLTQSNALATSPPKATSSKPKPKAYFDEKYLSQPERRDLQELSSHEMEIEFQKIHERSTEILKSLSRNPCEELTVRVTRCLQDNANEMSKCFTAMDDYRGCINEQVAKKIGQQSLR